MGDTPISLGWPELRREAVSLIEEATGRRLTLRLLGSAAIRLGSPEAERILLSIRKLPKDLDFICPRQDRRGLRQLFEGRGYIVDKDMLVAMEGERYLFRHQTTKLKFDLFVDRLEFCHTINLGDRLADNALSIPLEELILSKLQIVKQTESDLIDLATMFYCHPIRATADSGAGIDAAFIAGTLSRDWRFWRTASTGLSRLESNAQDGAFSAIGEGAGDIIVQRLQLLQDAVAAEPKSIAWKLRSKIGERMQWWEDVDDREGTY